MNAQANDGSPLRTLRQAAVQLALIVAPAAWAVGPALLRLAAGPPNYDINISQPSAIGFFAMLAMAMLPVLICLVAVFGSLSLDRLPVSLARAAAQLGVLFLSVMALMTLSDPPLRTLPAAVAIAFTAFAALPLSASLLLRWFRWRLVRSHSDETLAAPTARYQFRLADVFTWITLIATYFGLGTLLLSRFNKEPSGWDSLGPLVIIVISLTLCVPTGLVSVVLTWLVLVDQRRLARWLVAIGLAVLWVGYSVYMLNENSVNPESFSMLATPPALALPGLALLGLARAAGWRMQRLPRRA